MKKIFKIHETDLHTMVENVSDKILKEEFGIVEKATNIHQLTESDLHKIIENTSNKILKEDFGY